MTLVLIIVFRKSLQLKELKISMRLPRSKGRQIPSFPPWHTGGALTDLRHRSAQVPQKKGSS